MLTAHASVSDITGRLGPSGEPAGRRVNPLVSHDFPMPREVGSATGRTGWAGRHLVMQDEAGAITGIAPCYRKSHSQGEYVFDYGWADAFQRAGGRYYPKLQCAVPFTPVTGSRLHAATPEDRAMLADGLIALCAGGKGLLRAHHLPARRRLAGHRRRALVAAQ